MATTLRIAFVSAVLPLALLGCKSSRDGESPPARTATEPPVVAASDTAASAPTAARADEPPAQPSMDAAVAAPPPAPPAAPERSLAKLSEDLDGDGKAESIEVGDRTIRIGELVHEHGLMPDEDVELEVSVVDLNRADERREILVVWPWEEGETSEYFVFAVHEGAIVRSGPIVVPARDELAGDGTLVVERFDCGQKVRTTYRLDGGKLVQADEARQGEADPGACMACPYVFVRVGDEYRFVGEVLRHLVGPEAQALQSLRLPSTAVRHGELAIRVAEHKPETTYLDDLYLVVGELRLRPRACAAPGELIALCASDDRHVELSLGQSLDLVFDVPEVPAGTRIELWARGYYVPRARP